MSVNRRHRRSGRRSRQRAREILCLRRDAEASRTGDAAIARNLIELPRRVEFEQLLPDINGQLPLFARG